ncbi:hypothetical protein F373_gp124 [Bacillus phage SP-10]|uniref:hypothetical protein n=1 Tax=Bacillus phage SP10 TaxID=941058 RepID=UPI0002198B50|nr:hypothetical protein F373_gp124 [Bacillus phage SP-10]BAK52936.1 hypothetical protein [Bacillus phage SP-10]
MSQKVLNKVKHLLNTTTENGASEEEAQSAFLKAQRLLAKHDLKITDVDHAVDEKQTRAIHETGGDKEKSVWWKRSLANIIADNFRCYTYFQLYYKGYERYIFVGKGDDAEIAKTVFEFALKAVPHYAKQYVKKRKKEALQQSGLDFKKMTTSELRQLAASTVPTAELMELDLKYGDNKKLMTMRTIMAIKKHLGIELPTAGIKNDWIKGFLQGLRLQFKEQREQNKEEWGLILVKDEDLVQYYENIDLKSAKPRTINSSFDAKAIQDGVEKGKNWSTPSGAIE